MEVVKVVEKLFSCQQLIKKLFEHHQAVGIIHKQIREALPNEKCSFVYSQKGWGGGGVKNI